jgi:8-oxo-dGTP pyrophosphatase MutT (NUDIX family)
MIVTIARVCYSTSMPVRNTTSCGACVYRDNKNGVELLLVRPFEDRDAWGIPKGHIGLGETVEQCAVREVKEETGLDVLLEDRLTIVYARYGDTRKKLYAFLARRTGGKISNRDA